MGLELRNDLAQFNDLKVAGTFRPVMTPADDHVATFRMMAMPVEVAALIFKLNTDALPLAGTDFIHGFAVGEILLKSEHAEAEAMGEHAEKENHAEFVHRLKGDAFEIDRRPGQGTITETNLAVGTA